MHEISKKVSSVFFVVFCLFVFFLFSPYPVHADGIVPCHDSPCTLCHLIIGISNIVKFFLDIVITVAIVGITISGIMYTISAGTKMMETAKSYLQASIMGFAIAVGAWLMVNVTLWLFSADQSFGVGKSDWHTFECDPTSSAGTGGNSTTGSGSTNTTTSNSCSSYGGTCRGGGSCQSGESSIGQKDCDSSELCCAKKGTCGGYSTSVSNQCDLASAELSSLLSCMQSKGSPGTVTSVTASNVGNNLSASQSCCGNASCTHATYTCHYGCNTSTSGYSHAVDIGTSGWSDSQLCQVADASASCGGGKIWGPRTINCSGGGKVTYWEGHSTHLHVSTGSCNH